MIIITYRTYSKVLDKYFTDTKEVKSMDSWNLFNLAMFHGQAEVISTKEL